MLESIERNNRIKFKFNQDNFVKGIFQNKLFEITEGQDYTTDAEYTFERAESSFVIIAGRKSSRKVASDFEELCGPYHTTFNHLPDELNFFMLGNLELTFGYGAEQYSLMFADIMLAQGTSDNNWWFGGFNCTYVGDNRVVAIGYHTDEDRKGYYGIMQARRGGNDENEVVIEYIGAGLPMVPQEIDNYHPLI